MAQWLTSSQFKLAATKVHPETNYLTRPLPSTYDFSDHERSLVTVFNLPSEPHILKENLQKLYRDFQASDDVFRPEFLQGVIVRGAASPESSSSLQELWNDWGTKWQYFDNAEDSNNVIPSGPYVVQQGHLAQVWRLYDDHNKAFLTAVWPSPDDESAFTTVNSAGTYCSSLAIPVPSRLYSTRSPRQPLAGLRVGIKDIFHLKGVKTSCCSRGYLDIYPVQSETAQCIQSLIDQGAHIVGKTHLSSFAMREEPTECVDFQAPFNPRADGYQSPAGSSSGSGAAIASYDWLDITIGTDTTGSGRRPALWNGSFGMRPSGKVFSPQGMVATCPRFDSPSFFTRGVVGARELVSSWYGSKLPEDPTKDMPWAILWPSDFLPVANAEQMRAIGDFTAQLAQFLNVEPQVVNMSELWEESKPSEAKGKAMHEYLENAQEHGFFWDAYHCFDDYRKQHEQKFGAPPYVTEVVRGIGRLINEQQRDEAHNRFGVFRQWFLDHVLKTKKQHAIMLLPIEKLEPRYRDDPPGAPSVPPRSINVLYLSPALLGPELVVPIGEVAFESRITERTEFLPCAVSLLGPPGSDLNILNMVEDFLRDCKRPLSVDTGRSMGPSFTRYSAIPASSSADQPWIST